MGKAIRRVLVQAQKAQKIEVDTLKTEVDTLEAELDVLRLETKAKFDSLAKK